MINIKILEKQGLFFKKMLKTRKFNINLNFLIKRIKLKNKLKYNIDKSKNKINNISKYIKNNIKKKNLYIKNDIKNIKKRINYLNNKFKLLNNEINNYCANIPNIPDKSIFKELDTNNSGISYWGNKKIYKFCIKNYIDIGNSINFLDFKTSSKISGSRFVIMKNKLALIHRALIQFMLDLHINKHNYEEIYVPLIVNDKNLYNTGQLPKFKKNIFFIENSKNINKLCLIPTSEVSLVNIFKNKILNENEIPIKYVSYTPCFRNENNTYGKNSHGLIRLNQFDKVELIQIVNPKLSSIALEEITGHAENVLKLLNLHYRKRLLFPNEMSFSSCKTYDLEVWFPYKKEYIEVSSCSNTSDFQSRKMLIRFKNKYSNKYELLHILNASGLAINRTLAAIIENYQNENMDFEIPEILIPYMKSNL